MMAQESVGVPLLDQLNGYGERGNNTDITGNDIGARLSYQTLLDLLPNTSSIAIREPAGDRRPLSHSQLRHFIHHEFPLQSFNLSPGSRVGILLPNGPELAVCLISVISNWCAIPISPQSTSIEIEHELKGTQSQAVLVMSGEGSAFGSAALIAADNLGIGVIMVNPSSLVCGLFTLTELRPVRPRPLVLPPPSKLRQDLLKLASFGHDQISLVLHTSGTSGNKKRVPYTLDNLVIGVGCIVSAWNLSPTDVNLNMMPLFHIGGIVRNVLSPILSGGSVITCSGFDPVLFWDILQSKTINYQVTWYYAAPTMHHAILQQADVISVEQHQPRDNLVGVSSVRFIANAAGALLPALAQNLQDTFHATILTGYGMTECMPISSPPQSYKLSPQGTSGIPCGPSVLIVDPDHQQELPVRTAGHIMIAGAPCFIGYEAESDESNEESFFTINGRFGYFDTGDIGYLDEEGYLYITGRSKEVINRGGETISPFEIEEALIQHPSIKEAAVFSVPHSHFQETIGAILVMKSNTPRLDLSQLHEYLVDHLQRSKWPQVIVFMDNLPKNNTNKILRIKLAERMNLPEINDDMTPLSRTYEGNCPIIGTPLKVPIAVEQVEVKLEYVEDFIKTHTAGIKGDCVALRIDFTGRIDTIVAFISPHAPETEEHILKKCQQTLPGYMCPYLIVSLDPAVLAEAKLNPAKLNLLAIQKYTAQTLVLPRNPIEAQVEVIWRTLLNSSTTLSVTTSFFDLGGDSLQAGQLVNAIRKKMNAQISVADLFLSPTIEKLSHKISALKTLGSPSPATSRKSRSKSDSNTLRYQQEEDTSPELKFQSWEFSNQNYSNTSLLVLFVQALPILIFYPLRRIIIWFTIAIPWVYLMEYGWGRFHALVSAILLSRLVGGIMNPLIGVLFKWLVIGKYKPGRYPLWGSMYLRWWIVEQVIMIFGMGFFRDDIPIIGYQMVRLYYVLMGAKIGENVRIHKDAKIGQADLLTIGDNVVIDVATIRPFAVEEGHMILLPITIEDNCSVGLKSSLVPGTHLARGTCIGPLSSSHEIDASEEEDRKYCRTSFASPPAWMILLIGVPILTLVLGVSLIPWYYGLKYMIWHAKHDGWYVTEIHSVHHAFMWWITPQRLKFYFLIRAIKRCVVPIARLILVILIKWTIIGKFQPLSGAEKQTSWNRFRYWLMSKLLPGGRLGGVSKLVGTHYEIVSIIFRALGAKIGKRVYWPGSGLEIVEYDLLNVGNDVVFGSRSVVLTSSSERSATVTFEDGSMVADRCVILPGLHLKKAAVLGSGSLAPEDFVCPVGSIWVGSRDGSCINVSPEDRTYEVKDTISPFGRAFYEGKAPYTVIPLWGVVFINMFWQAFCTCYHNAPTVLALSAVSIIQKFDHENIHRPLELFQLLWIAFIPVFFSMSLFALVFDIVMKWFLLGRRKQGAYPWDQSNYCQNWQLYLTLEEIRRGENGKVGILDMIRGSQYLVWYFRLLGATIGENVCLYPNGGDPMMTEPDLVKIGDGSSVDDASLIAHINTRGVFRLNPVIVGKNCVLKSNTRLLSGAQMSDYSIMQEHTLVLAGDTVDSGSVWQGWPSNNITPLETYRKHMMNLVNKAAFRKEKINGNNGHVEREKVRKDQHLEMMEESKTSRPSHSNSIRPHDSFPTQKKVSFKNSPDQAISPLSSSSIQSYSSISPSRPKIQQPVSPASESQLDGERTPLLQKK